MNRSAHSQPIHKIVRLEHGINYFFADLGFYIFENLVQLGFFHRIPDKQQIQSRIFVIDENAGKTTSFIQFTSC